MYPARTPLPPAAALLIEHPVCCSSQRVDTHLAGGAEDALCVLALLLQRVLGGPPRGSGPPMNAAACFATLATCRLNRYEPNELLDCDYSIAQVTLEQATILRDLDLT
jgi:hypothetical protein